MTDDANRSAAERAPSRDPAAHLGLPDVDEDAGDAWAADPAARARETPFLDNSNANPEIAARAAGPWPASEEAPAAEDRSTEDAFQEPGLRPSPGDATATNEGPG
jgi:hypothetical protein